MQEKISPEANFFRRRVTGAAAPTARRGGARRRSERWRRVRKMLLESHSNA
jgi:hypothetical protein